MNRRDETVGIYVSVPFCASKCSYCNFASGVFARDRMATYVARLCDELARAREAATAMEAVLPRTVDTIYFGGGTPSLLPPELLTQIASVLRQNFDIARHCEWTIECAPGQLSGETLAAMVAAGVNRISFGAQSFVHRETAAVGRLHSPEETFAGVEQVRAAGIENISVDLIAGLPHQTRESFRSSVRALLELAVPHASVYMLEVDEDSRLGREMLAGGSRYRAAEVPDDDTIAAMYEEAREILEAGGLSQYEISNFARNREQQAGSSTSRHASRDRSGRNDIGFHGQNCHPERSETESTELSFASRHNLRYWERRPYLGTGLDAHSMLRTKRGEAVRFANADTLDACERGEMADAPHVLTAREELEEALFLGLRRCRGVDLRELREEFGWSAVEAFHGTLRGLESDGLLARTAGHVALTSRGLMLSNDVFARFLLEEPALA